jgi:ribosomal protein S18 acetylase RimI-like enzyme
MSPSYSIRAFDFDRDLQPVLHLWANAGPGVHVGSSDSPERLRHKLERDPDLFLVAEVGGRLAGTVLGGYDGRRGLVYHLAVDPTCRQQGIGSGLMEELERRLRQKGCHRCYLLVVPGNEEAVQFYEARGWERMELFAYGKDLE